MAFNKIGYGQVEPNQLSGIKTGQIFASLPLDDEVKVLQNGEFMFYDYAEKRVACESETMTEPYLVFQEIKIYEDWLSYKDFAMIRVGDNYVTNRPAVGNLTSANTDGTIYGDGAETIGVDADPAHSNYQAGYRMDGIAPRLVKTNIGDIYTTNMVAPIKGDGEDDVYKVGDILKPIKTDRNTLELSKAGTIDTVQFAVVQVYTMPDGQPGLKLQRIA